MGGGEAADRGDPSRKAEVTRSRALSPEGRLEVARAAAWYEAERPGLGTDFLDETERLLARIESGAVQFPVVERNVRRGLMRRFPYAAYFTETAASVFILAVIHLHRHPDAWRARAEPGASEDDGA